jgi:hypothetical protein
MGDGVCGSEHQTNIHLPQSPFTGQFLDSDILHCLLFTGVPHPNPFIIEDIRLHKLFLNLEEKTI